MGVDVNAQVPPKMSKPQWVDLATLLRVEPHTTDRRGRKCRCQRLKDVVEDSAHVLSSSQPAVNGRSATAADLFSHCDYKQHVDSEGLRASAKEVSLKSLCCPSTTTPAENMHAWNQKRVSTGIVRHCMLDVAVLSKAELMQYAFALGVPTRKKTRNGHRCRRALRDVRADCVTRQRQGPSLREQFVCGETETRRKKGFHPGCGKKTKAVRRWAFSLGIETRKRDQNGKITLVWRRVQDLLSDCIRLSGTHDLSSVLNGTCKSIMTRARMDHKPANSLVQLLNQQRSTKEQTSVGDKIGASLIGSRTEVMQRAFALGIETRRGSRAEVMQIAADLGIETRKRDQKNQKRWRGVREVWQDVIDMQKSCHAFGIETANHISPL